MSLKTIKITELPEATTLNKDDLIFLSQEDGAKTITVEKLAELMGGTK